MAAWLFVALQRLLPQHLLSRLIHRLARSRSPWLKNALTRAFVRAFRPVLADAAEPDPLRYACFNDFFTRALRAGTRPLDSAPDALLCPVDGTVSQIGHIRSGQLLQAKGRHYALEALLGEAGAAARFAGGAFATLYLAPYNYHRIHMPLAGVLQAAWYVPGRLFSVNALTAAACANLFARNERVVCLFETSARTPFAMVLVGALFVGSIATCWHGDVTPRAGPRRSAPLDLGLPAPLVALGRGAEMGRFNMGSTVILLFPPGTVAWQPELHAGARVQVGQRLGRWLASP